jgi:hypothetical protein
LSVSKNPGMPGCMKVFVWRRAVHRRAAGGGTVGAGPRTAGCSPCGFNRPQMRFLLEVGESTAPFHDLTARPPRVPSLIVCGVARQVRTPRICNSLSQDGQRAFTRNELPWTASMMKIRLSSIPPLWQKPPVIFELRVADNSVNLCF